MAKPLDLIGKKFGSVTVIDRAENNKRGNTMWFCKCDCGNNFVALGYDLTHKRTTSCGCRYGQVGKPSANRISLVGEKFGKLTVVGLDEEKSQNGKLIWRCVCECGNNLSISGSNLKSGHTKTCGCSKRNRHARNFRDLTGMRFGRLTVLRESEIESRKIYWECVCDCGNNAVILGDSLKQGHARSCGCLAEEIKKNKSKEVEKTTSSVTRKPRANKTHGLSKNRIYREYQSMIQRCSPKYHCRNSYYDKGIGVCEEWTGKGGFENFCDWSMSNGYAENLSLDRKDNSKGYSPDNCRWTTMKIQQNNKDNNVYIEYLGETKTMRQWCDYLGLNYGMVKARRRYGWEVPKLFEPPHKNQYQ